MTEVRFYHMQSTSLEHALPEILGKALEREFKALVRVQTDDELEVINKFLWTYKKNSFLPHGAKLDGTELEQPIFISAEDNNPNDANLLMLIDGATSEQIESMDLCCELFDGNNEEIVTAARTRWKEYTDKGYELSYFQQDSNGRWVKK